MSKRAAKRAFERYFEWVRGEIYIRVDGKDTTTTLDELLEWFHENQYTLKNVGRLSAELEELWAKHNRLLAYLELEDVTTPEVREIRKAKKRVVRAATKPRKQAKRKRVSP